VAGCTDFGKIIKNGLCVLKRGKNLLQNGVYTAHFLPNKPIFREFTLTKNFFSERALALIKGQG